MKKLLLLLFVLLAACGGPDVEDVSTAPEIAEKIVEVIVEVTAAPTDLPVLECPPGWPQEYTDQGEQCPDEWDVLYFQVIEDTILWKIVGENENGDPIFMPLPYDPADVYEEGDLIIAYNGKQATEYYRNDDGSLAIGNPTTPNGELDFLDEDGEILFPGLWCGDVMNYSQEVIGENCFYKVVGPDADAAGLFVRADRVVLFDCEYLTLSIPESCTQVVD